MRLKWFNLSGWPFLLIHIYLLVSLLNLLNSLLNQNESASTTTNTFKNSIQTHQFFLYSTSLFIMLFFTHHHINVLWFHLAFILLPLYNICANFCSIYRLGSSPKSIHTLFTIFRTTPQTPSLNLGPFFPSPFIFFSLTQQQGKEKENSVFFGGILLLLLLMIMLLCCMMLYVGILCQIHEFSNGSFYSLFILCIRDCVCMCVCFWVCVLT